MKILTLSILSFTAVCVTAAAQDASAPAGSTVQADKQFLRQLERTDQLGQNPVQGTDAPATATPAQPKPAPVAKKTSSPRRTNSSAPVKTADQPATATVAQERPQTEIRPVEKKSRREVSTRVADAERSDPAVETNEPRSVEKKSRRNVNTKVTAATVEQAVPADPNSEQAIDPRAPSRVVRERTPRNNTLDPFYETGGSAPVRTETRSSRIYTGVQPAPAEVAAGPQRTVTVTRTITAMPAPQPAPRERDDDDGFFHRLFHHKDRSGD